jgi:hypothetical protein
LLEEDSNAGNGQINRPSGRSVPEPGPSPTEVSTSALIIGQTTAVLAVAAAVVYAAGGLALGLKLWYDQFPLTPILGQLPRDFFLANAIIVVAPAIILGLVAYPLYKSPKGLREGLLHGRVAPWLLSLVAAVVLAMIPIAFLPFVRRTTVHGFIRPYWQIFLACLILNFVFIRLALYLLSKLNISGLQGILAVAILAFAFIPAIASVSATYRFPIVKLCGPAFSRQGTYSRYAIGNLIGTNGQWAYVSEAFISSPKPNKYVFNGSYIAVIPLSEVQLEAIGSDASCGDLYAPTTP